MTLFVDGTASARLSASVRGVAWLAALDFSGGMLRLASWPVDVTSGGDTYLGVGRLFDVANIHESADSASDRLSLSFTAVNTALLALAATDPTTYRGRVATLKLQVFDDAYQPAGAAVLRWRGYMDKMQVSRQSEDGEGSTGRIELVCSRAGMARSRNADGLRLTDAQQQARYPGDTGLRYVRKLIEQPALWLSKRFQQID